MSSVEWPEYTRVFGKVTLAELKYIQSRRQSLGIPADEVAGEAARVAIELDQLKAEKKDPDSFTVPEYEPRPLIGPGPLAGLVGLALSGGGIRSATFNLGLLQALARQNVLRYCDYLSTVSGGGYIGSCLSSLLDDSNNSVDRDKFPFGPKGPRDFGERKEIKWLREHSNYLAIDTSFFGWDIWRMIGMYLSGLVLTNLLPFAIILLAFYFIPRIPVIMPWIPHDPADGARWFGALAVMLSCMMVIARWGFALRNLEMAARRWREYLQATWASATTVLAVVSGCLFLIGIWPNVESSVDQLLKGASVASILGVIVGAFKSVDEKTQRWLGIIARIALALFFLVLFLVLLRLAASEQFATTILLFGLDVPVAIVIAGASLLVSGSVNPNRLTLHHFYRDRLSEAYIIKRDPTSALIVSNEWLTMAKLHAQANGAPYHLINATLNVPDTRDRNLIGRKADFFLFSKFYCGAETTGYRGTDRYDGGGIRVATALAVSGVPGRSDMGTSSSPFLAFVLTLLNIRLNRWMINPRVDSPRGFLIWPYYFVKELFGKSRETDLLLNLSDGGNHENLGVYSLVRRGCRYIIASDASTDPAFATEDFANLMRKLRMDLGIDVAINLRGLRPDPITKNTPLHYAVGRIKYPGDLEGILIYIKSSVTGTEPEDLLIYHRQHLLFPRAMTSDRYFDEAQFESYRKLGELIGDDIFSRDEVVGSIGKDPLGTAFVRPLFESLLDRYEKWCASMNGEGVDKKAANAADASAP